MTLAIGTRLGPYEILSALGAGGMGEVYRAHDTRLGRDVAIKILPAAFTSDPERLARFEREARALAALNHPNIATIHGLEDSGGVRALVMELVPGPTLTEKIAEAPRRSRPGLQVPEAVRIAGLIAQALDAAHEKGIIHRDLKPANIKVTPDGGVKVLDFGLAKLTAGVDPADAAATAPTITAAGTRDGQIVGTAAYMSPEQARGHAIDKRTDIWAFGCVLYEMLTGRAAFARETITDTLAAVVEREPDWTLLPDAASHDLRHVLGRCLEKDPKRRARDVADVRAELEWAIAPGAKAGAVVEDLKGRRRVFGWMLGAAGLVLIAGVSGLVWTLSRGDTQSSPAVTRTTVTLPPDYELDTRDGAGPLAIAPDGSRVAYVAFSGGRTQLYIRDLNAFEAKAIAGTEGAQHPFFSPDSEWIAFFADRKLKRVSIRAGSPAIICDAPAIGWGGTWGADGTIVFDPGVVGLMRVPATGGPPELLTSRDAAMDASNLSWPQFLPDGQAILATIGPGSQNDTLAVLSLKTGEWHRLGRLVQAQYVTSGHLLYHAWGVREGELHAVAFDAETLALRGTPVPVIDSVFRAPNAGAAFFAVAQNGTLVFTPGGYARTLIRVDRTGRRTPLVDDRRGFRGAKVSPDGRLVAVTVDPRPSQIWVYDLVRRSGSPLATDGHNLSPLWTPDGKRVTYSSNGDMCWRTGDASTPGERLLARDGPQYPTAWSADGRLLFFNDDQSSTTGLDVWVLPLHEEPRPLVATAYRESAGQLSPDGRWLAYQSDESGRLEVYVRPFPNVDSAKWTVSTAGGQLPQWSPTGRELFYAVGSSLMRVRVDNKGAAFMAGTPELLFSGPFFDTQFTVSPDGQHFIMVEADPNARPTQVHVVLNWAEEIARLVPPR